MLIERITNAYLILGICYMYKFEISDIKRTQNIFFGIFKILT
jgi:hypothetical protein